MVIIEINYAKYIIHPHYKNVRKRPITPFNPIFFIFILIILPIILGRDSATMLNSASDISYPPMNADLMGIVLKFYHSVRCLK